jgi:hypothetical protein
MYRSIDVIAYALLIIGALGWGLVGFLGFDVTATIFGGLTVPLRMFSGLVGIAALYDVLSLPWIVRRWEIHLPHHPAHA